MNYYDELPRSVPVPKKQVRQLVAPWTFRDQFDREWTVQAGFESDGASIPTVVGLAWALLGSKHDPRLGPAAWAHDWLCTVKMEKMPSKDAHELFRLMCIADTVSPWRARAMKTGIQIGGPDW